MTKDQKIELKRYKSALIQYQLVSLFPFLSYFLWANAGFCHHFQEYCNNLKYKLPVLCSLKPKNYHLLVYSSYWYTRGQLEPRIKLLKQAIKILKQQ